jgi:hypothetical protein
MLDKNGKEIKKGDLVRVKFEVPILIEKDFLDLTKSTTYDPKDGYIFKKVDDENYAVYLNGVQEIVRQDYQRDVMEIELPYSVKRHDLKKGDKVLAFGFEGGAVGLFRYEPSYLEVIEEH